MISVMTSMTTLVSRSLDSARLRSGKKDLPRRAARLRFRFASLNGLRPIFSQKHNFVSKLPNCVLRENARLIANVNIIPQLESISNKNTLYSMQISIF